MSKQIHGSKGIRSTAGAPRRTTKSGSLLDRSEWIAKLAKRETSARTGVRADTGQHRPVLDPEATDELLHAASFHSMTPRSGLPVVDSDG